MPVYTDRKTKRLYIQIRLKGEFYKERLPKEITRKQAEILETKTKARMLFEQHGIYEDRKDATFERFLQDVYLPHVEHHQSAASFEKAIYITKAALPFFKGRQLRAIRAHDIEKFMRSRMTLLTQHGTQRKASTVAREMAVISKLFTMAVRNELCDSNPCTKIDKPFFDNIQDRILKPEDQERFLRALPSDWVREVCIVVLNTGLRANDVMNLTRFQCDMKERWIRLIQGKTRRVIDIRINAEVYPILEKRIAKYKDGRLFPSPKTGGVGSVRHTMLRTCAKLEIPPVTIRDLRRTFGTRIQPMVDTVTAARMMGHSDLRSIHRYQRSLEMIAEATDSLAGSTTWAPLAELRKRK